jgi:uncharacterized protein
MPDDAVVGGRGFHPGELAVQEWAGVRRDAGRLEGMLGPVRLGAGVAGFLAGRTYAALTARDGHGLLWTSPLIGAPGFIRVVDDDTLRVLAAPGPGDPLERMPAGQPVGLIVIDYARRRRFRLNGTLTDRSDTGLTVEVLEAFGNCPQYIPRRTVDRFGAGAEEPGTDTAVGAVVGTMSDADRATIGRSDTFILGSTHPDRGNDASHRGGAPGFVRTDEHTVWWPDYAGNNMFTSLGNLSVDPEAALLFLDFHDHTALHLNGTAELRMAEPGSPGDDGHTGRLVVVTPRHVTRSPLEAGSELLEAYADNPDVRSPAAMGSAGR